MEDHLSNKAKSFAGKISRIVGSPETKIRLIELGFLVGDEVRVLGAALGGGPLMIEVRGTVLALRREEAKCIMVS